MRFAKWGSSGFEVSVIGQGSWNIETYPKADAIAAFHRGIEIGMTHVDTAFDYGRGKAESFLGEALAGKRDQVFLVSKVLPEVATYEGTIGACEGAMQRLRTDYLDCFLLHWLQDNPLDETIAAFEKLQADGKIRCYGMSNLSIAELGQAIDLAGPGRIVCHQIIYNLQCREIEREMIPFCREHNVAVVGYAPYGDVRAPGNLFHETLKLGGGVLESIAESHGVSTRNVVIAYVLRRDVFTIPKGERPEFAEDNARAADLVLTDEDVSRIDAAFPLGDPKPIHFTNDWYALQDSSNESQ